MTTYAWAAVLLALVVAAAALMVALALATRVRQLAVQVTRLTQHRAAEATGLPATGFTVPPVTAIDLDGDPVTGADLAGADDLPVLFFSATCSSCRTELPKLRDLVLADSDGRAQRPLVVVSGDRAQGADLVDQCRSFARVVVEDAPETPVTRAFKVRGFPAVVYLSGGVVRRAGHTAGDLRVAVPSTAT